MLLDVSRALRTPGEPFPFELAEDGEALAASGAGVGSLALKGEFMGAGETVFVRGHATAVVEAECARCLKPVTFTVRARVDEVFGREVDPDNPDQQAYQGHTLDVGGAALSAALLELPMRALCQPGCKGLCPECGHDLNDGPCGHEQAVHGSSS